MLVGEAFGVVSPVATFANVLYLDIQLAAGGLLALPVLAAEMAVYAVDGEIKIDGEPLARHTLAVLEGKAVTLKAVARVRLMVIGGEALAEPRLIWWNFVSSQQERIRQASEAWLAQRMGQVPGESEWIPLPERRPVKTG